MPLRTFSIHFFTYCFHAGWISNAIRSPLSQGRAGGGGGDADGKALVSPRGLQCAETAEEAAGAFGGRLALCVGRRAGLRFAVGCPGGRLREAGAGSNPSAELEPNQLLVTLLLFRPRVRDLSISGTNSDTNMFAFSI